MTDRASGAAEIEADVIVVGAGTAGCIIAAGLSDDPDLNVLIVEAGPMDRNPWLHIPVGFSRLLHNPRLGWGYRTVPQPHLDGRQLDWPRGRVVGGSGATNGMVWVRGAPADFDRWADVVGDESWSWEAVQDRFRACEAAPEDADPRLGRTGPIRLSRPAHAHPLADAFKQSAVNAGFGPRRDLAISDACGAGDYLTTVSGGIRVSSASAYLKPVLKRRNLRLLTGARAAGVELHDRTATGIRLQRGTQTWRARARLGVVLSAGAVNSPQLLMLSGIGDPAELSAAGIIPRIDLSAVGRNLQDHFGVRVIARLDAPLTINDDFRRPWRIASYAWRYARRRNGPLAVGGAYCGAFLSSSDPSGEPDLQIHFLPLSTRGKGWRFHRFSGVTANVCQLRPWSRGSVALANADPAEAPTIDPRYLADERDARTLVSGLRMARRIFQHTPFKDRYGAEIETPDDALQSDDELLAHARATGTTVFHPVGTCRMGRGRGTVVDTSFRVHDAERLWVADASVIPFLPSGNTNATTMMLAHKALGVLREEFGKRAV